jgi:hypothetical protein
MVRCNIILDNFRHNYIIATAFRFTSGDIWSDVKRCFYVIFTSDNIEASSKRYSILLFITGIFFADVKPLLLSKICTSVISSKESFACCCCCYRMLLVLGLFRVDCGPVHQLLYLLLVLGNSSRGCFKCFHYLFRLTYSLCGLIELLSFMSLSFYFFCNFFLSYIKYCYEYIYGRGLGSLGSLMILGKYVFAPSNYINFHF